MQAQSLQQQRGAVGQLEDGDDDEAGVEQHDGVGHQPVQLRQ